METDHREKIRVDVRHLIAARRYAEAYELLYRLLDGVIDPDNCARELTWICEHWDRVEEANVLRLNYGPPGMEQFALFEFRGEQARLPSGSKTEGAAAVLFRSPLDPNQ